MRKSIGVQSGEDANTEGDNMFHEVLLLEGHLVWNIPLLAFLICVTILYACVLMHLTPKKIAYKQPLFFFLGLGLLYLTLGSPLTTISHYFFSSHMVQMSLVFFIVPPFLLLGIPEHVFQRLRKIPVIQGMGKRCLTPKVALYAFAVLFLMYHLPFILNIFAQNPSLHKGYIVLLFIMSFSMWWPIATPDTGQRFGREQKKRYAVLSGLLLLPACSLFILNGLLGTNNPFLSQLTTQLCLSPQASPTDLLPFSINTRVDQFMGGVLMLGMHKFGLVLTFRNLEINGCTVHPVRRRG